MSYLIIYTSTSCQFIVTIFLLKPLTFKCSRWRTHISSGNVNT